MLLMIPSRSRPQNSVHLVRVKLMRWYCSMGCIFMVSAQITLFCSWFCAGRNRALSIGIRLRSLRVSKNIGKFDSSFARAYLSPFSCFSLIICIMRRLTRERMCRTRRNGQALRAARNAFTYASHIVVMWRHVRDRNRRENLRSRNAPIKRPTMSLPMRAQRMQMLVIWPIRGPEDLFTILYTTLFGTSSFFRAILFPQTFSVDVAIIAAVSPIGHIYTIIRAVSTYTYYASLCDTGIYCT